MAEEESDAVTPEMTSFEFRAEIRQLLHILVHSLYTDREIFLRELISNASDALNRLQFEMLTRQEDEVVDPGAELAIHVSVDAEARTLTITDTGIGMTAEEVVENLGTIARSGAAAFLQALQEQPAAASEIIGQFGVGFYSVFMVADRVEVRSRSFSPHAEPVLWISSGGDTFELGPSDKENRGTEITVHLTEEAAEFAQSWRVESIIRKHSNFVAFPIYAGENQVNRQTALWRKSPREVEPEAYQEFYQQLTLDPEPPLTHIHIATEVPYDLQAILYVPARRDAGIFRLRQDRGLKLYSRKVLIQEYNKDLLPTYLTFVEGVVDSEDLPLNISRETVQSHRVMAQLKRALSSRMLKELERLAEKDEEKYRQFWNEFGIFLKEGVATEFGAQEELAPLLRFHSSTLGDDEQTSLRDYKERMAAGQEAIYYVLAEDLHSARRSPHLDPFLKRDLEVLMLVDPIDSFMLGNLREFDETPLRNAASPAVELPPVEGDEETPAEETPEEAWSRLLAHASKVLGERVADVREGRQLTGSPVRLVPTDDGREHEMDRVRRWMRDAEPYQIPARVLELNRSHPLVRSLADLASAAGDDGEADALLDAGIEQLYESALLLEGLHPNPADMVPRIQQLLEWATRGRAGNSGT
jgi:HSP90 family molecular chaperone